MQSCGAESSTESEPVDPGYGGTGLIDASQEGSVGGSKAGSGGAQGGTAGAQGGGGGSKAGSGGASGGGGKAGAGGTAKGGSGGSLDAGKDADASSGGKAGSAEGGAGVAGSPVEAGPEAAADAIEESDAAPHVCQLQTNNSACQTCMLANCNDPCLACEKNPFCQAIVVCVGACTDDDCKKQCWENNKDGQENFNALASQKGCLHDHCVAECPGLPDTGGCAISANRSSDSSGLWLVGLLGLRRLSRRRRSD